MPITWHEECLQNSLSSLSGYYSELSKLKATIEKLSNDNTFYAHQITKAKEKGLDGFDSERFLKKSKEEYYRLLLNGD